MEKSPQPEPIDPKEIELLALRTYMVRQNIYALDIEAELTRLRRDDPYADELIRYFSERYFHGSDDMAAKEKVVRILLTVLKIKQDFPEIVKPVDADAFIAEIESFLTGNDELPEPPQDTAA